MFSCSIFDKPLRGPQRRNFFFLSVQRIVPDLEISLHPLRVGKWFQLRAGTPWGEGLPYL